jgi:hypothetical protein
LRPRRSVRVRAGGDAQPLRATSASTPATSSAPSTRSPAAWSGRSTSET